MILGIPAISRPDLLQACIASIDTPLRLVVIDNSPDGSMGDAARAVTPPAVRDLCVARPPSNIGVAASWNLVITTAPAEPFWLIANADTVFGPGDLDNLARAITSTDYGWLGVNGDWRLMAIKAETVERVGLFDTNFHPIYCEDADYEYRCRLAGIQYGFIRGTTSHVRSATIQEARFAQRNARTYPANVAYYQEKWGGPLRGGERFATPFDRGGSVADWTLDFRRVRDQGW